MITTTQLRQLEEQAELQGVSAEELMDNAGEQVYLAVRKRCDLRDKRIIIFAGQGNNAGDGFVAAGHFVKDNSVLIFFFGHKEKLSEAALENYEKVRKKVNIIPIHQQEDLAYFHVQDSLQLVLIDALLGIGATGAPREPIATGIEYFNSLLGFKVAVDVPSGINPDTGEIPGKVCDVDLIVTFHDLKTGLEQFADKTVVVDIGFLKN